MYDNLPPLPSSLTVKMRVQLGRDSGSHVDGGIVPFEQSEIGPEILDQLRGKDR